MVLLQIKMTVNIGKHWFIFLRDDGVGIQWYKITLFIYHGIYMVAMFI